MRARFIRSIFAAIVASGVAAGLGLVVAPAASAAPLLCDQFASARVDGGRYVVQNNRWGASTAQCIDVRGNGFAITRADHDNSTSGPPASYPSIFAGCHYATCTTGSGLPLKVSAFGDVRATYQIDTPQSGEWNASFDLWFDPTQRTDGQNTGAEVMIWANHRGRPQPIGARVATVTIEGAAWDVWVGNIGWNVISYVRQQPTNDLSNFSVKAFVDDAVGRGQIDRDWYMTSVQAGFEPWIGGTGLAVRNFAFTTAGTGGTPSPTPSPSRIGPITGIGGKCVDVLRFDNRNGAPLGIWNCTGAVNQKFTVGTDGTLRVYGRCLGVAGASTSNGASVVIGDCSGGSNQQWAARANGTLVNPVSGKCLDAVGQSSANGTRLQLYACRGDGTTQPNQVWRLP